MTREQWKDLIEITSAFAIVVSLIFVGFEVRQNTDAVRSTVAQAVSQQSYDAIVLLIENNDLRTAQSAIDGAPPDENMQLLTLYYAALIRLQLNRYMQAKLGVIDAETVIAMGGGAVIYDRESFREFWALRRDKYDPEFVSFMEELVFSE